MENQIYHQISARTGGDIYIGVVGPVRTGKSTLIKRFMETMVLPGMENVYKRERARDELPQSGTGRTIMTAEPKFVPEEAAEIRLPEGGTCRVRLVDCVGYLVDGALGSMEDDAPRMVSTPWREEPMTLAEAAEVGTHKVIGEHSTIGLVVTTDGSFSDIPRENYAPAEKRVIEELSALGKPFLVLVNSVEPGGEAAQAVCASLHEQYGVEPVAVNCIDLTRAASRTSCSACCMSSRCARSALSCRGTLVRCPRSIRCRRASISVSVPQHRQGKRCATCAACAANLRKTNTSAARKSNTWNLEAA